MHFEMEHRCGHLTHANITGRDRAGRAARAQADHASQDCGICRSLAATTYTDFTGGRYTTSDSIDVVLATHKPADHVLTTSPYPGGGIWAYPAWTVTVRRAADNREIGSVHRLREHHERLVPPAAQDVRDTVDSLLARIRSLPAVADASA